MQFDKFIKDVQTKFVLKNNAQINDVVILLFEEENSFLYAMVRDIEPNGKKGSFNVRLLLLSMPPVNISLNLTHRQLSGKKAFRIHGSRRYIAPIMDTKRLNLKSLSELVISQEEVECFVDIPSPPEPGGHLHLVE